MTRTFEETGLIRAQSKWVRSSARKARVVLVGIRGRSAPEADRYLQFATRVVARDIQRVLRSAVANAETNHGYRAEDLVVERAFADEGVTIKRFKPRARGRASKIEHKTSHITVLLRPVEGAVKLDDETVEEKPRRRQAQKAADVPATELEVEETVASSGDDSVTDESVSDESVTDESETVTTDEAPVAETAAEPEGAAESEDVSQEPAADDAASDTDTEEKKG